MTLLVLEVVTGGLLTGTLYSLVVLGFVLIFKASNALNCAQGATFLNQSIRPAY
jgi:branched-chain amino acid transport system permease protein